uniref:CRAL-TRIO domain-containing protein n=1 Tax=Anguilla anguilla TaxID=7936 RepID=A0A0E9TYJ0_ANGAN
MKVVMLNSLSDLHGYVDKAQLTHDFGGTLEYCHSRWINHRTVSWGSGSQLSSSSADDWEFSVKPISNRNTTI